MPFPSLARTTFWLLTLTAAAGCSSGGSSPTVPVPQPTAAPTPAPDVAGCGLPPGPAAGSDIFCPYEGDHVQFLTQVERALDQTVAAHPEIFNLSDGGPCGDCYAILDEPAYEKYVIKNLEKQGLCAIFGEEVGIKLTNDYNEQWKLEGPGTHIRRQIGAYRATCHPAAF